MRVFTLSFCFALIIFQCSSERINPDSTQEELKTLLVEKLEPYREVIEQWIPSIVNSPESPTNYNEQTSRLDYIECSTCRVGIDALRLFLDAQFAPAIIIPVVAAGCAILTNLGNEICTGAINSFAPPVMHIIKKPGLKTDDICGILIPGCGVVNSTLTDWDIDIDANKPTLPAPPPLGNVAATKILQFTDIHLDLDYVEGTKGDCGRPAGCCRDGVGIGEGLAGKFGHFSCSLPETALTALFTEAHVKHPDVKYIYLTGDFVHSAIWLYSVEENLRNIEKVTTLLSATFGDGVKVFPVVGNHETQTVNMYAPEAVWQVNTDFDLTWLYDHFLKWIPVDQHVTFKLGGYYTVRPDPAVPFRLVVLNTNLCYLQNFWLPYDTADPTGQLKWFAKTMLDAEKAGEIVHILGHIQPGSGSCWTVWSGKFDRIIKRFGGIIQGLFYGHAHREYFTLSFDDAKKPNTVSYVGPSGVTDRGHTAYKLYEVDGQRGLESTWEIINHKTYVMNLTSSNLIGTPQWLELFSAKEAFGLSSLRANDLYDFVVRMVTDDDLFKAYLRTHHKGGPNYNPCEDMECRGNTLCDLVVSNSGDNTACNRIKDLVSLRITPTSTPNSNGGQGLKFSITSLILGAAVLFVLKSKIV